MSTSERLKSSDLGWKTDVQSVANCVLLGDATTDVSTFISAKLLTASSNEDDCSPQLDSGLGGGASDPRRKLCWSDGDKTVEYAASISSRSSQNTASSCELSVNWLAVSIESSDNSGKLRPSSVASSAVQISSGFHANCVHITLEKSSSTKDGESYFGTRRGKTFEWNGDNWSTALPAFPLVSIQDGWTDKLELMSEKTDLVGNISTSHRLLGEMTDGNAAPSKEDEKKSWSLANDFTLYDTPSFTVSKHCDDKGTVLVFDLRMESVDVLAADFRFRRCRWKTDERVSTESARCLMVFDGRGHRTDEDSDWLTVHHELFPSLWGMRTNLRCKDRLWRIEF